MSDPDPIDIVHVTMLRPFFDVFRQWVMLTGFEMYTVPGGNEGEYIVIPSQDVINRMGQ